MSGPTRYGTISTVTQHPLGTGVGGRVSSLFVQFDFSASPASDHSISIVGRHQADGSGIWKPLGAVAYKNLATGAIATAALTADAKILVEASGMDIFADITTMTTGSVSFTCIPLLG